MNKTHNVRNSCQMSQKPCSKEGLILTPYWICFCEFNPYFAAFVIMCAVLSCSVMSDSLQPHGMQPARLLCPWGFSRQEYWSGCPALLQGIFPTQGSNPGLPHCMKILYCLSHQGNPVIPHWEVYPFSRPRNQTRVSCIAGRPVELPRKSYIMACLREPLSSPLPDP